MIYQCFATVSFGLRIKQTGWCEKTPKICYKVLRYIFIYEIDFCLGERYLNIFPDFLILFLSCTLSWVLHSSLWQSYDLESPESDNSVYSIIQTLEVVHFKCLLLNFSKLCITHKKISPGKQSTVISSCVHINHIFLKFSGYAQMSPWLRLSALNAAIRQV